MQVSLFGQGAEGKVAGDLSHERWGDSSMKIVCAPPSFSKNHSISLFAGILSFFFFNITNSIPYSHLLNYSCEIAAFVKTPEQ